MYERRRKVVSPTLKKKGLSIAELKKLLKFWQSYLGLKDWAIDIKIVDFIRNDFRQCGDFKADFKKKNAKLYLTRDPFLKNQKTIAKQEEQTIVHELVHILIWELDSSAEKAILKHCKEFIGDHDRYLDKLENTVEKITHIFLKKKKG